MVNCMENCGYDLATIGISPILPIRGIYYIGQYGTCGYAMAARGYLYHYFSLGIPITWEPLYFDDSFLSKDDPYDIVVSSLIGRNVDNYDMVIMHSTPDLWPTFWTRFSNILKDKVVVGYCTWETNKLPPQWVECINSTVGEVWCPSVYNQHSFLDSGVCKPIRVVPHVFLPKPLPPKHIVQIKNNNGELISNDIFTFYTIGEMNARKGIEDMLRVFCRSFNKYDSVRFIIKVHYKDYSEENKEKCKHTINEILSEYPDHPQVITILDCLTGNQILGLHAIGDCYVSLTKSEGFGLTIFDAFNYGKKIITTGFGGQLDFLGADYPGLVKYELGPVKGMNKFSQNYDEDQIWAYPNLEHAQELMRKATV